CVELVNGILLVSRFNEAARHSSYHRDRERSAGKCRFLYANARSSLRQAHRQLRRSFHVSPLLWRPNRPARDGDDVFCVAGGTPRNTRNGTGGCAELRHSEKLARILENALERAACF